MANAWFPRSLVFPPQGWRRGRTVVVRHADHAVTDIPGLCHRPAHRVHTGNLTERVLGVKKYKGRSFNNHFGLADRRSATDAHPRPVLDDLAGAQ